VVRTIKKYTLESFSECTGVGNVVEVVRKSVPGGWTTVGETSFPKSSAVLSIYSSALTLTDIVGHGISGVWSRAGFKGGQTGQLPRASTTRGPP